MDRHLVCGCILCICENDVQCQGCGAKLCAKHAKEAGHYTEQPPEVEDFKKRLHLCEDRLANLEAEIASVRWRLGNIRGENE